jgi:pyruvate/2-oxoglutarate dehydrogenase complex dihydrolipoamide dehydrogenase (E3) component
MSSHKSFLTPLKSFPQASSQPSFSTFFLKVLYGLASFTGGSGGDDGGGDVKNKNEVVVGDKTYTADHVMIAVGGKPRMPDIPGVEHCIDSDG